MPVAEQLAPTLHLLPRFFCTSAPPAEPAMPAPTPDFSAPAMPVAEPTSPYAPPATPDFSAPVAPPAEPVDPMAPPAEPTAGSDISSTPVCCC